MGAVTGWAWGVWWWAAFLFVILVLIWVLAVPVRRRRRTRAPGERSLRETFARGEITREEFEQRLRDARRAA